MEVTSTTAVTNLNADQLDGYHASNAAGDIPISNGVVNTNLNAEKLDGKTAQEISFGSWVSFNIVGDDLIMTVPSGYTGPTFSINSQGELLATFSGSTVNLGKVRGACPYDVGDIYQTTNSTNPSTKWAGTTWEEIGAGRVLVGHDPDDTDFDTVGKTGGSKTHTHGLDAGYAKLTLLSTIVRNQRKDSSSWAATNYMRTSEQGVSTVVDTNGTALGGATDNGGSLMPYLAVYMWKRIT